MNDLRSLDDRLLTDVNDPARHTGSLHGVVLDQPLGAPTGGHAPVLESTTRGAITA